MLLSAFWTPAERPGSGCPGRDKGLVAENQTLAYRTGLNKLVDELHPPNSVARLTAGHQKTQQKMKPGASEVRFKAQ
ncbi:unnamed protein product [Lota lota]